MSRSSSKLRALPLLPAAALLLAACAEDVTSVSTDLGNVTVPVFNATSASAPSVAPRVSAGGMHTCALRVNGVINCWGRNDDGQAPDSRSAATGGHFVAVSAGSQHTCALTSIGRIECWGGDNDNQTPALWVPHSGEFVQVTAGSSHTCAVRDDGVAQCVGRNHAGQAPETRAASEGFFTQIAAGGDITCALTSEGIVECWGRGPTCFAGMSVCDDPNHPSSPTHTPWPGSHTYVAAGASHSCAVTDGGSVTCRGFDGAGAVSGAYKGDLEFFYMVDTRASETGTFVQVAGGSGHTCARTAAGNIECWGTNDYDQAPELWQPGLTAVFTQVSAGADHTCAIRSSVLHGPTVVCRGRNDHGQARSDNPLSTEVHLPADAVFMSQYELDLTGGTDNPIDLGVEGPCLLDDANVVFTGVGVCTISGFQSGDDDYLDAHFVLRIVINYDFSGFAAPVDATALNVVKAGRAVPLKWRLLNAAGAPVLDLHSIGLSTDPLACDGSAESDPLAEYATGASGLQNLGDGYYQYNWKTPSGVAGTCRMLNLDLGEVAPRTARFRFVR